MNMPATDEPEQTSHDKRLRMRNEMLQETTGGLLDGEIHYKLDRQFIKFIANHKFKSFTKNNLHIPLVTPNNQANFQRDLRDIRRGACPAGGYTNPNQIERRDKTLHRLYYINQFTTRQGLFDLLDRIYAENHDNPFKISCDAGFINEVNDRQEYKRWHPDEMEVNMLIPLLIKSQYAMNTYKHYLYSFISEKTEMTHENSRNKHIWIRSFLFTIRPTNRACGNGKSTISTYDGYDWTLSCRGLNETTNNTFSYRRG